MAWCTIYDPVDFFSGKFPNLTHAKFTSTNEIGDNVFKFLRLKTIILKNNFNVDGRYFKNENLEFLSVPGCINLKSENISQVSKKLMYLDVSYCESLKNCF